MKKILTASLDFIFKLLFGSEANVEILAAFLAAAMELPADELEVLTIMNTELPRMYDGDKLAVLDVKVRTKHGSIVDLEVQIIVLPSLPNRVMFYIAKMLTEQLTAGDRYEKLQPVTSIVIAAGNMIDDDEYYHNFRMRTPKGVELTNLVEVDTLELKKLPEVEDGSAMWSWAKFLKAESEEELAMIETRSPELKKAVAKLREYSADEKVRLEAEERERALRLYYSSMSEVEQIGVKKGEKQGQDKMAAMLIEMGVVSPEVIAEATRLLGEQSN